MATRSKPSVVTETAVEPAPRAPRGRGPSVNRVTLIGRLTADPEMRHTAGGIPFTRFRLAIGSGESASFHDIVAWRRLAEITAQHLTTGRLVYVGGRLQGRHWTGRDGVKRYSLDIVASEFRFLSPRPAPATAEAA